MLSAAIVVLGLHAEAYRSHHHHHSHAKGLAPHSLEKGGDIISPIITEAAGLLSAGSISQMLEMFQVSGEEAHHLTGPEQALIKASVREAAANPEAVKQFYVESAVSATESQVGHPLIKNLGLTFDPLKKELVLSPVTVKADPHGDTLLQLYLQLVHGVKAFQDDNNAFDEGVGSLYEHIHSVLKVLKSNKGTIAVPGCLEVVIKGEAEGIEATNNIKATISAYHTVTSIFLVVFGFMQNAVDYDIDG